MELLTIFVIIAMVIMGTEIIRFVIKNDLQRNQKIFGMCIGIVILAIVGAMIILNIFEII